MREEGLTIPDLSTPQPLGIDCSFLCCISTCVWKGREEGVEWRQDELAEWWHLAKGSSGCGHVQDKGVSLSSWSSYRDRVGAKDRLGGENGRGDDELKNMTKKCTYSILKLWYVPV